MLIREAILNDVQPIQALSQQLGYDYPIEKTNQKLRQILINPEHKIFVALKSNQVIGYIHVEIYRVLYADDLLNILGIVVDTTFRNQGVGTALINAAEELSKKMKCGGLRANSGAEREDAHLFYKKNKFNSEKNQKRFIKHIKV